jgi:hypothetical protein
MRDRRAEARQPAWIEDEKVHHEHAKRQISEIDEEQNAEMHGHYRKQGPFPA